ncbi:MAG: twin-arginine translocase subunit TatC [Planctomycetes bacterium]|nr:twin-arginine translocase subunit TatC [Planctomycetota bacterium]
MTHLDKEEQMASMSLGDHLEELRTRLILAISGLFIGLVICMCFGSFLIDLLLIPYDKAMKDIRKDQKTASFDPSDRYVINLIPYENARKILASKKKRKSIDASNIYMVNLTPDENGEDDPNSTSGQLTLKITPYDKDMEIPETVGELKSTGVSEGFFAYLTPYEVKEKKKLTTISPSEGFMVYLKTSLIFGLMLTCPWVFWQIWAFVASGLYKKEKKFAYSVAPASAILFIAGSIFFMTTIAPLTMKFFVKFDEFLGFTSQFRPSDYINMILLLTLVFGVAFQMPIVIVFAERMGLVSIEMLTKNRKFVILGLVILSAMITPPDFVSQLGLAGPLYILFEISILACRFMRKRKERAIEI